MKYLSLACLLLFAHSALAIQTGPPDTISRVPGAGGLPKFGSIDLSKAAAVGSSVLAQANGGTGKTTFLTAPTFQKFTAGSGTYTTPAGVLYIRLFMLGAGGGGRGGGTGSPGSGGNGGDTTFGANMAGGGAGNTTSLVAPLGGLVTQALGVGLGYPGGQGSPNSSSTTQPGGIGGVSAVGAAGVGGANGAPGTSAANNSGSGGGGGGGSSAISGGGGGAGAYIDVKITSPSATYSYAVGTAGAAGTGGTSGGAGGAGGSGIVLVEEFYQ